MQNNEIHFFQKSMKRSKWQIREQKRKIASGLIWSQYCEGSTGRGVKALIKRIKDIRNTFRKMLREDGEEKTFEVLNG